MLLARYTMKEVLVCTLPAGAFNLDFFSLGHRRPSGEGWWGSTPEPVEQVMEPGSGESQLIWMAQTQILRLTETSFLTGLQC